MRTLLVSLLLCAPLSAATIVSTHQNKYGTWTITEDIPESPTAQRLPFMDAQSRTVTADFRIVQRQLFATEITEWPSMPDYLFTENPDDFVNSAEAILLHFGVPEPQIRTTIEGDFQGRVTTGIGCSPEGLGIRCLIQHKIYTDDSQFPIEIMDEVAGPLLGSASLVSLPEPSGLFLMGAALLLLSTSRFRGRRHRPCYCPA